jgi:SPP1 gp7 family putative phage head morphogenesis protein
VKQSDWKPVRRVEQEYYSAIWNAIQKFFQEASESGVPAQLLNAAEFLEMYARQAAARMVTGLLVRNARTWREAARESGKTQQMYAALQREMQGPVGDRVRELIRENAQLITTLPKSVALLVAQKAAAQQQAGGRPKELASALASRLARHSAMRLARTEYAKASSALTEARSEEIGIPAYIWETNQDERVRESHRKMQGVIVFWNDPPAPEQLVGIKSKLGHYNVGNCPNDRCYAAPIIKPERLQWPHRCYTNGRIQYITLSAYRRLAGLHQEMAA